MLFASSAGMTASLRTLQNRAILARSLSGAAVAAAEQDLGLDAEAGQLRTLCWVGLVFSSPAAAM
jgi:hypothetical protein